MKRFRYEALVVIFWTLVSSRVAVSVVTLECDSLQQLCDNDDQPRMCMCTVTGNILIWRTSITSGAVATFISVDNVGTSESEGGFTGVLTERANGMSVSTLTFNPSTVRPNNGVSVTCEGNVAMTTNIAVTSAVVPGVRQFETPSVSCDLDNRSYQVTLQWNDGDTGGPDVSILYYLVEVTSSPPGFVCPPEQCNVTTTNTTNITGLSCSTEYNFTVRAVNCVGSSSASMPHITSRVATPGIDRACFVNNTISITLQDYNTVNGNCMTVSTFNISSSCTGDLINTDYGPGDTVANLSASVIPGQSCEVRVIAVADCEYSLPAITTASEDCTSTPPNPTTMSTMSSMTDPPSSTSSPLTITKACLIDNSVVSVQWMPPSSDSVCGRIQHYSLMVSNSTGVLVTMTIEGQTRSVSVSVSISDYYNISLSAISGCGNTTSVTTIVSNACVDPTTSCQLQVGVGIPVTFLLTAIISSLITLLITCLIMRRRESHDKFTPSVVQEPVYDPVSVSGTRPGDAVEMKSNVAYGTTGLGGGANITYETVPQ